MLNNFSTFVQDYIIVTFSVIRVVNGNGSGGWTDLFNWNMLSITIRKVLNLD